MGILDRLFGGYPTIDEANEPDAFVVREPLPSKVIAYDTLPTYRHAYDDGEKFYGGFGETLLLEEDYWTTRARSAQLFERNLYARGLIRRIVTNVINTGLCLESTPFERVLGKELRSLEQWGEDVEDRFTLWASTPWLCDHMEQRTFGMCQADAQREALIEGDILCVLRPYRETSLPRVQYINGSLVVSGGAVPRKGNTIEHGVELDQQGRHVAYWVRQKNGETARLPAWGEKSKRRIAWLHYGSDKRINKVRGTPLLKLTLQALKEMDRYRDASLRKMVITSMIAGFIEKTENKPGSSGILGGAVKKTVLSTGTDSDNAQAREIPITRHIPGMYMQELQHGEKPQVYRDNGAVDSYGVFEGAILDAIAWSNEIPPEIFRLGFSNNYSASQASINEFKMVLNMWRTAIGASLCQPVYEEWLVASVLAGHIEAPGLLESWRDISRHQEYTAWVHSDWSGQIKPAVDLSKLVGGSKIAIDEGLTTRQRVSRELFGLRFSKVVQQLRTENEMLREAREALGMAADGSSTQQQGDAPQETNIDAEDDDTTQEVA